MKKQHLHISSLKEDYKVCKQDLFSIIKTRQGGFVRVPRGVALDFDEEYTRPSYDAFLQHSILTKETEFFYLQWYNGYIFHNPVGIKKRQLKGDPKNGKELVACYPIDTETLIKEGFFITDYFSWLTLDTKSRHIEDVHLLRLLLS